MARAGLGWSGAYLAKVAGVTPRTVIRLESGNPVTLETQEAIRAALVKGGALFVDVEGRQGVTLKRT